VSPIRVTTPTFLSQKCFNKQQELRVVQYIQARKHVCTHLNIIPSYNQDSFSLDQSMYGGCSTPKGSRVKACVWLGVKDGEHPSIQGISTQMHKTWRGFT